MLALILFPYSFIRKHFMNFYYVQGTRKETKECLKIPRATPGNVCMSSVLEEVEHLSQSLAVGCTQ